MKILEMIRTQCKILHLGIRGRIIVSYRRYTVSLPYLLLQRGLPNEASIRMRIDRNRQFGIFFDISTFTLQIDVSIGMKSTPDVKPIIS